MRARKLDISIEDETLLEKVEIIRNIIAHSGGKINDNYLKYFDEEEVSEEGYIILSEKFLGKIMSELTLISGELFVKISIKYFKKKEPESSYGIPTRGKQTSEDRSSK